MLSKTTPLTIDTAFVQLPPHIRWVYAAYRRLAHEAAVGNNNTRLADYKRWSVVDALLQQQTTLIDVGVGAGQFVNAAAKSKRFTSILGLDTRKHSALQTLSRHWTFVLCDITSPSTPSMFSADSVLCMQTLAYLSEKQVNIAISNMLSIASKQLIITLPLNQSKQHKQAFTLERIRDLFPTAALTLGQTGSLLPWCLIHINK
jgi:2-polyprenyl-3-methyl-5-hydroxy-6-metoxy-1,4-benzoquinol methylase